MTDSLDCGDNSCMFATKKGGMRTNHGCRCLEGVSDPNRRVIIRRRLREWNDLAAVTAERDEALHAAKLLQRGDSDGQEFAHVTILKADLAAATERADAAEKRAVTLETAILAALSYDGWDTLIRAEDGLRAALSSPARQPAVSMSPLSSAAEHCGGCVVREQALLRLSSPSWGH